MFTISYDGLDEVENMFSALPQRLHEAIVKKTADFTQNFTEKLTDDALSGGILQSKTGALKDSVVSTFQDSGEQVNADVSVGDGLPYAAIQEYGGTTKAHIIEAINGKALAFAWHGKTSFFQHVEHPGSVIPEHGYMSQTVDATQPDLLQAMQDALTESIS